MLSTPAHETKHGSQDRTTPAAPRLRKAAPQRAHSAFGNHALLQLRSAGAPLDPAARTFMESRLGHDFGQVRVHADASAAASAESLDAVAYTVGHDVVFGRAQYAPHSPAGLRLLAHELTHVVQQSGSHAAPSDAPQASLAVSEPGDALEVEADRIAEQVTSPSAGDVPRPSNAAAPAVQRACSVPSGCPSDFCTPFSSTTLATIERAAIAPVLLAGIAAKVSPRVVGLWNQYLFGGSAAQDLSATFGADFTASTTTATTTDFLVEALKQSLESSPPSFPAAGSTVAVDIPTRIGPQIAQIGDPTNAKVMDFNTIGEIPGNIAGGVGKDQLSCSVGAQPSPFNDDRTAIGTAQVTQNADGSLSVAPALNFTVRDTIDFCPGNCGAPIEQVATVPMSRYEATGISGDVPFTVNFPAPPRTVVAHPPVPTPPPTPPAPAPPTPAPKVPPTPRGSGS